MDRLGLAPGVARADQEVVGVAEHAAQVELDDVDRLLVLGVAGDLAHELRSAQARRPSARATPARARRARARGCSRPRPRPTSSSIGSPAAARCAHHRGGDVDPAASRGSAARAERRRRASTPRDGALAARACGRRPLRAATARSASSSSARGSRHAGSVAGDVRSDDERQLGVRMAGMYGPQGIDGVGRAAALELQRAHLEAARRRPPPAGTSPGGARRPGRRLAACAGACGRASARTRVEPELARARGARARGARDAAG